MAQLTKKVSHDNNVPSYASCPSQQTRGGVNFINTKSSIKIFIMSSSSESGKMYGILCQDFSLKYETNIITHSFLKEKLS